MRSVVRVGIPRALAFYDYGSLWMQFFAELNIQAVISPPTNRSIVDIGVRLATDGTCLPVKTFYGHTAYLASRSDLDWIFVPRIIGVRRREFICPKFMGLPDLARHGVTGKGKGPRILAPNIDLRTGSWGTLLEIARMARSLGVNPMQAIAGYQRALAAYLEGRDRLEPRDQEANSLAKGSLSIGIIGHRYLIEDGYLSMDLVTKLRAMGVNPIIGDRLPQDLIDVKAKSWPKEMYWRAGRIAFGSARAFLDAKPVPVNGVIYIAAFSCGTDSIIGELVEREMRRREMPFLAVNLDEHTGEAGMITRLEAFVDLIRWRKDTGEMHFSAHG